MDDLRMPEEWERILGFWVRDPDGWRNNNLPWDEPLTRDEFQELAAESTTELMPGQHGRPSMEPVIETVTSTVVAVSTSFRGLSRAQSIITAWETIEIVLEVADFVSNGGIRRGITNYIREKERPATIRVMSERRPVR